MDNSRKSRRLSRRWDTLPELEAVRVFAAVAELASVRGAAAALGLPRSTVSRRLATLEASLGLRLLQRTTRQIALTEAGATFLAQVTPALQAIGDAGRQLLDAHAEPRGLVKVSAPPMTMDWVAEALSELAEKYPRVRVQADFTDRNVDLIAEGYDIAIRTGALADSSLMARPLGRGRGGYFASPQYLAAHPRPKRPADLEHHECIVFLGSSRGAGFAFQVGRKLVTVRVRGRVVSNQLGFVRRAAVLGRGIAWLPLPVVRAELAAGSLAPVLERYWPPSHPLQLVYPSARELAPQIRVALDHLAARLAVING
jgi:DNA-binding transcriptional LysR family regulator